MDRYSSAQHMAVKEVGDEALLIWHNTQLPVCVAKSRVAGVKLIEEHQIADLVLLDDGLQHRALGRTLDIVSAYIGSQKAKQDFIKARLLPWGRFREIRAQALKRAKIVILSHRKLLQSVPIIDQEISDLLPTHCQIFQSYLKDPALKVLQALPASQPLKAGSEVVLLSAIAEPQGMIDSVESLGFKIKQVVSFMDHHLFSANELDRVGKLGYPVVCSTKDSVKIPTPLYPKFFSGLFVLEVRTEITNREDFFTSILSSIRS
jgi:tetraacyldisaccharide 4'-kinase